MEEVRRKGNEGIKSIAMIVGQAKQTNLDILAKKRQWEQEKRGNLISADASWLYQTSTKINNEIDKRLSNLGGNLINRNTHNRESFQSRLLERITTKK